MNLIVLALLSFSCGAITAADKQAINQLLQDSINEQQLRGVTSVAVVDEHGLAFFTAYSRDGSRFDKNTPFLIASHTKAMTGTLFAILADEDRIDINRPVSQYDKALLSSPKLNGDDITIKQLLTHTGGFTSIQHTFATAYLGYDDNAALVQALNQQVLVAPDKSFRYSNTGPIVASMILETVTGKSWQQLMQEKLFSPLGLSNTTTGISDVDTIIPAITSAKDGEVFSRGHHKTDKTMHAAGGVVSTISDMATWLQVNINQDHSALAKHNIFVPLHSKQVPQSKDYFSYRRDGYTLGWDTAEYNGERILTRFGNYGGYSTHVSFMPERKLGIIAFTNLDSAYALPHLLANFAYNRLLNKDNTAAKLAEEKERVKAAITRTFSEAPDLQQIVAASTFPARQLGSYSNEQSWPSMVFYVEAEQVKVRWGVLSGTLLKKEEEYYANLGVIERPLSFQLNEDQSATVTNGSLRYSHQ
ncbi:serine hydrolase domain-containing protein [Shewanella sedimentimangrovi]|uniref:Beta-lactamase family protein n=1 Tax=Shewanella sedimentimangrovi TaxID=2814293 RepID=A0ABX7R4R2_9GAMM|nr:serine hydrolase domain-containing protein [Shewanella sedimentimangrovi]QSX37805.1 beta-lactamase family protein [Shewanella sedimentimangrovi]